MCNSAALAAARGGSYRGLGGSAGVMKSIGWMRGGGKLGWFCRWQFKGGWFKALGLQVWLAGKMRRASLPGIGVHSEAALHRQLWQQRGIGRGGRAR